MSTDGVEPSLPSRRRRYRGAAFLLAEGWFDAQWGRGVYSVYRVCSIDIKYMVEDDVSSAPI